MSAWGNLPVLDRRRKTSIFGGLFQDVVRNLKERLSITDESVSEALDVMHALLEAQVWRDGVFFLGTDFKEEACCAYLKYYAAIHAELANEVCLDLMEESLEFTTLVRQRDISIASVGGGPGNDLFGLCRALSCHDIRYQELSLAVIDLIPSWRNVPSEIATIARNKFSAEFSTVSNSRSVTVQFVNADLSLPITAEAVREADVLIMTKVLSVVPDEAKTSILDNLFSSMKESAIFIYIDIYAHLVENAAANYSTNILLRRRLREFKTDLRSSTQNQLLCHTAYEVCVVQKMSSRRGKSFEIELPCF